MGAVAKLNRTAAPAAVVLIRVLVGWVFVSEGIGKFLYAAEVGAGRFARIGIPAPEFTGPFVGAVEIGCGALILLGLFTRLAAVPLLVSMAVAVVSTKVPILLGHGFGPFSLPRLPRYGLWSMLHEARTDFSMVLGLMFLVVTGGGRWSLDARLFGRPSRGGPVPG